MNPKVTTNVDPKALRARVGSLGRENAYRLSLRARSTCSCW